MLQVTGKSIDFLLDMGAAYSVLTSHSGPTVPSPISVTGVDGIPSFPLKTLDTSLHSCRVILLTLFSWSYLFALHLCLAAMFSAFLGPHSSWPPYSPEYFTGPFTGALQICQPLHKLRGHQPGKVEKANGLIKRQLTKLSTELRLSWPSLLPIALTHLWATPRSPTGLSPFELLYGRPFLPSHHLPAQTPPLAGYLPLPLFSEVPSLFLL
ncbi:uncharacterized protein LOC128115406 [Peromyscus californicus insignis]|uniref:uncharacterized protein LOC128115406 n=1 Tax=Peromyscus californicus insignis TaxID=564181 RepID=UPI0022A67463|nr:uncharacterized protein LOC128115406 [Peromyscus californicus insignis]